MNWRFTLLDRNAALHVIDEPVGWDACEIVIKRDLDKHGATFNYTGNEFLFYDEAARLIKAENDTYGIEGDMTLIIEMNCSETLEELYRGKLVFKDYKSNCGDECFIKIPLETTGDIIAFLNRFDQKVNLQTEVAFDEVTPLVPYEKLPFEMVLPSKGILLKDYSKNEKDNVVSFDGCVLPVTNIGLNIGYHQLEFGFTKEVANEIGVYGFAPSHELTTASEQGYDPAVSTGEIFPHDVPDLPIPATVGIFPLAGSSLVLNYAKDSLNYGDISNPVQVEYSLVGLLELINCTAGNIVFHFLISRGTGSPIIRGPASESGDFERVQEVIISHILPGDPLSPPGSVFPINISNSVDIVLGEADRFYFFISMVERKDQAQLDAVAAGSKAFRFTMDEGTYFKTSNLSRTEPTLSKMFMVNEALSRITETITDNRIKAYSEYFGRTDSLPYSHAEDGCGSLEAITKGLFIRRQENRIPDQPFLFSISMKDMWEGLDPIHHIGFGMEADTNRPGYNRLRIEPWKHFYSDTVVLTCNLVNKIERRTIETEHYSTFKFGYEKWEAEEYNGLDEFLTKRGYRTSLFQVKNELSKLSKMIASGYAWEITRRKGDLDSKDWRYDNETFIACLERYTRSYALNLTGQFIYSVYYSSVEPVGVLPGDTVTITGSALNNGTYTIDFITDFGGGSWGIYFVEAVVPETIPITMTLFNPGLIIELGNVLSPANIIDPGTLYNYRISPVRNALRWLNKILASYKHLTAASKILFTEGDGNYFAEGEMESTDCKWENRTITENQTLDVELLLEPLKGIPLLSPERIEYEYPMSFQDFRDVFANPYGKIEYNNHCESGEGWIDVVTYKPESGMAKFTLIPKYQVADTALACKTYHLTATTVYGATFSYVDCDGNYVANAEIEYGGGGDIMLCMLEGTLNITHGTMDVDDEGVC